MGYIIAAEDLSSLDESNNISSMSLVDNILSKSNDLELRVDNYIIDPLLAGFETPPVEPRHFRSGNAPLMAIDKAIKSIDINECDLVVISGQDYLKTQYTAKDRHKMMEICDDITIPEMYTLIAKSWCKQNQISHKEFIDLAANLFDNYQNTYKSINNLATGLQLFDSRWKNFITDLFRGIDCANPVIDFSGRIVICGNKALELLKIPSTQIIDILAISNEWDSLDFIMSSQDSYVDSLARFNRLVAVYQKSCQMANLDFNKLFIKGLAYLEVYTCFPIVPLAFLFSSGLANNYLEALEIIKKYPLTITGGMNLAKAPWNNPVLRTIISMYKLMLNSDKKYYGGIHGNGGITEKQGFLILSKHKVDMEF